MDEKTAETIFRESTGNAYEIFQLKQTSETRDLRFASISQLQRMGVSVVCGNYQPVYAGAVPGYVQPHPFEILDVLYQKFNLDHLDDFTGHSLSIGDMVALKLDNRVTCYYVDSFGFREIPDFLKDNPLRNAEMSLEDDLGMIDGIINNGRKELTPPGDDFLEKMADKRTKDFPRLPLKEQLNKARAVIPNSPSAKKQSDLSLE